MTRRDALMNLKLFLNLRVHIVTKNGKLFEGEVVDYCYPEDNKNGMKSIILDAPPVEFYEKDISEIQCL